MAAQDPTDPRDLPRDLIRAEERAREHAEFRSLLVPSREVPRFEPLTVTGPEPEVAEAVVDLEDLDDTEDAEDTEEDRPDDEHDAFRRVVVTEHAIPRFEPLEGAGEFGGLGGLGGEVVRRRRSSRRRSSAPAAPEPVAADVPEPDPVPDPPRAAEPAPVAPVAPATAPRPGADRRETFILVAVLAVLIVLATVYTATQRSDQPSDSGLPQGASRVSSQPLEVRA